MDDVDIDELDDEDDDLLLEATKQVELSIVQPKNYELIEGFDDQAGRTWVYPINYPLRSYQFNIVQKALYWNTLVTLPTGLGKTFVAAVVIHNFYRWYPEGKILFMAPTKPLVAQQIRACHDIVGIPQDDLGELTGNLQPAKRDLIWSSKRVFFLTPQIVQNDLARGSCPATQVVLVVIDEAHKSTGNHAYCQVIRELQNYSTKFRVLALSATPGDALNTVQDVLTNLLISHIEIRSEESLDIQPYTHARKIEKIIVPLDEGLKLVKEMFIKVLTPYIKRLSEPRAIFTSDPESLNKFTLLQQRESWRQRTMGQLPGMVAGAIEGTFALLMSLYHAFELLVIHGAAPFLAFCNNIVEGNGRASTSVVSALRKDAEFLTMLDTVQRWRNNGRVSHHGQLGVVFVDHPKLVKLEEMLLKHFNTYSDTSTRAMVFSSFRDSVTDISKVLSKHSPLLKPMVFVGQSGATGLKQKDQLEVVTKFKRGDFNVLVATCVGEEGLDIGSVDLIVCFDASASPTRLVQRMGRAARKRDGSIVILLTQGKEEQLYKRSVSKGKSVNKAVMTKLDKLVLYKNNPRMIPRHLTPTPDQQKLSPAIFRSPATKATKKLVQKKLKCPYLSSTQYNSYKSSKDTSLNTSTAANKHFELADCLSKWTYWRTDNTTFEIAHSMNTMTLVHAVEVQEVFLKDKLAIDNYEDEMRKYLCMDDVNDGDKENRSEKPKKKEKATKKDKAALKEKEKVSKKDSNSSKPMVMFIADSDDEEFEGVVKKFKPKQTKLIFSKIEKPSLFSCLPKDPPSPKRSDVIDLSDGSDSDGHPLESLDCILDNSMSGLETPSKPVILSERLSKFKCPKKKKAEPPIEVGLSSPSCSIPCLKDRLASKRLSKDKALAFSEATKSEEQHSELQIKEEDDHDLMFEENSVGAPDQLKHPTSPVTKAAAADIIPVDMSLSLFSALDQTFDLSFVKKSPPKIKKIELPSAPLVPEVPTDSFMMGSQFANLSDFTILPSQLTSNNCSPASSQLSDVAMADDTIDQVIAAIPEETDSEPLLEPNKDSVDSALTEEDVVITGDSTMDETFDGEVEEVEERAEESDLFESLARLERESIQKGDSFDFGEETLKDIESMDLDELQAAAPDDEKSETCGDLSSIFAEAFHDISLFVPPEASTPAVIRVKMADPVTSDLAEFQSCIPSPSVNQNQPAAVHPELINKAPLFATPLPKKKLSRLSRSKKSETTPVNITSPAAGSLANQSNNNETDDESPLVVGKRKRPCNILSTQAPIKSPNTSSSMVTTLNQSKNGSTDDDSPLVVGKRKRPCNILSTQAPVPDPHTSNENKKRKSSPQEVARSKKARGKCLFIDDEADLSGEDEEEDDPGEDEMDSSMEDFLDSQDCETDDTSMYLQAMHSLSPLVPKVFKPSYQGNVYSQEPEEESEDWRDSSFICDNDDFGEGCSELYDCLDETAVFTQAVNMTEASLAPRPKKTKKKKTKRVRNMSFESPGPSRVVETKTPQPPKSAAPAVRTPTPITPAVPTPIISPNMTADFTLGVDDLLDDLDEFSDDDFVESSAPKSKIITPTAAASKTQSAQIIINSVTKQQNHTFPTSSKNVLDLSKLAPNLSVSDLFNDTFDDIDPALLNGVCEAPQPQLSTMNLTKPAGLPVSSQFDFGVDDLIDDDPAELTIAGTNISVEIPSLKDRLSAKHQLINKTSSNSSGSNKSNIPPKDWVPSQPGLDLALSSIEEPTGGPSNILNTAPIVILVNTKALSNNQICTMLRSRHGVMVEVVQSEAADYIISWSTAVIRIGLAEVNNSMAVCKQCLRAKDLRISYNNVIVIAEKPLEQGNKKKMPGSKHAEYNHDKFCSAVKLFANNGAALHLSDSQSHTTSLLYNLAVDQPKIPNALSPEQKASEAMLNCVVNRAIARVISSRFATAKAMMNCRPEELSAIPGVSQQTLILIRKFFKMNVKNRLSR